MTTSDFERKSTAGRNTPVLFLYRWLVIAPFLALSTLTLGALIIPLSVAGYPDFASRVLARTWARLNMFVSLIGIKVIGRENINPAQSYVVVSNHQSLIDIYVLYGHLGVDLKWVMKKELRAVPVLGLACEVMGHIIVDRSNTEAALASINNARERIRNGISVVFFPEGTRSRTGELGPFKKGAFRLAQELGLPVLPVTVHHTRDVLPSDSTEIVPGDVILEIGKPIPTAGLATADVEKLAAEAHQYIADALRQRQRS
ncbi:MAG: lysophospholipid acyltransferase family protein [Pseudomonadota bacterium]